MKMESNIHATKLKTVVTALAGKIPANEWTVVSLVLVDAIAEIRRLEEKVSWLQEDRDYWQHKWGNGSA